LRPSNRGTGASPSLRGAFDGPESLKRTVRCAIRPVRLPASRRKRRPTSVSDRLTERRRTDLLEAPCATVWCCGDTPRGNPGVVVQACAIAVTPRWIRGRLRHTRYGRRMWGRSGGKPDAAVGTRARPLRLRPGPLPDGSVVMAPRPQQAHSESAVGVRRPRSWQSATSRVVLVRASGPGVAGRPNRPRSPRER
jgi:hypothetical protein